MKCLVVVFFFIYTERSIAWGFFAHKKINEFAVFCLSEDRRTFYRTHVEKLIQYSIIPDIRKNTSISEYSLHYIDIEHYNTNQLNFDRSLFLEDCELVDSCRSNGVLPWHINRIFNELVTAIQSNQESLIVRLSSELGHYISDACVPLHTTENYDGQLTNQNGIHGLWESSLPELFFHNYNLFGIKADTIHNVPELIWETIEESHRLKDSVLLIHKGLQLKYDNEIFGITNRNNRLKSDFNMSFKKEYHKMLNQMITKQLKKSILLCASLWETAWIRAEKECD